MRQVPPVTSQYASHAKSFAIFRLITRVNRPWVGSLLGNIIDFTCSTCKIFLVAQMFPYVSRDFFSAFLCRQWGGPFCGGGGGESSEYQPNPLIFDLNVSVAGNPGF